MAFFWVFVEPTGTEILSEYSDDDAVEAKPIAAVENAPNFPCPFIFGPDEEKPFLIQHVEQIGPEAFFRNIEKLKVSSFEEIDEV